MNASPGFWFHPVGCDCLYNPQGFLERECAACERGETPPPETRARPFEPGPGGQDLDDELAERSAAIGDALDAAFDRGQDDYRPDGNRDAEAALYEHPKLREAFRNGWDIACREEAQWLDCEAT